MLKRISFILVATCSSSVLAQDSSLMGGLNSDFTLDGALNAVDTWQPEGYAPNHIPKCPVGTVSAFSGTEVGDGDASSKFTDIAASIANDRADADVGLKINAVRQACNQVPQARNIFFRTSLAISRYKGEACEIFDGDQLYTCYQQKAQSYNCCTEPLQQSSGGGQVASTTF